MDVTIFSLPKRKFCSCYFVLILQFSRDLPPREIVVMAVKDEHTPPYSKMAANKLLFCLHVNWPSLPHFYFKNSFVFYTCRRGKEG